MIDYNLSYFAIKIGFMEIIMGAVGHSQPCSQTAANGPFTASTSGDLSRQKGIDDEPTGKLAVTKAIYYEAEQA